MRSVEHGHRSARPCEHKRGRAKRIASGFQPFRGMSHVVGSTARPTPVFTNESSADIARGSARIGGINEQSEEFQIYLQTSKEFPIWQLKIRGSFSLLPSFSQVVVSRGIKNILGTFSWKKRVGNTPPRKYWNSTLQPKARPPPCPTQFAITFPRYSA